MTLAILLIAVPVAFTALFAILGKVFAYPAILRQPAGEVLERFAAGGSRLVLIWWAFAMTAIAFIPIAVAVAAYLGDGVLAQSSMVVGVLAALVQALGLIRWPFLVPFLAREREKNPQVVDLVFEVANRYLGIAVGEHLGYLLTGAWTILVSVALLPIAPLWFAIAGIVVGASLLFGALEFVGPAEPKGWALAGTVVSIGYTAWAVWLVVGGVLLLVSGR
jgi:hypothetical protein